MIYILENTKRLAIKTYGKGKRKHYEKKFLNPCFGFLEILNASKEVYAMNQNEI